MVPDQVALELKTGRGTGLRENLTSRTSWAQWAEREAKAAKKDVDTWEAMGQEDVLQDMRDLGL